MEVVFTPETETQLTASAARQGRNASEIASEIVARYFEEESRFREAVRIGESALDQGEYLTHEEVGRRLERFLKA